jgi:serine/threonine-protein kinase
VRHPNVVSLIDVGEGVHGTFLVMDYVEGDTLSSILRTQRHSRQAMPTSIAMRIAFDMLEGLQAVHGLREESGRALDVVHRDVSPQNLLVSTQGVSRLIDLGIAKVPSWTQVTASRHLLGKIPYVSPEQVAGLPIDRRCDVWAAGVIVWEMLAGRMLYPDDALHSLLERVRGTPPRLRSVRSDVPPALDRALASALVTDAKNRCPSANELRLRLQEAWSPVGRIADSVEVGAMVQDAIGAKLRERRAAVDSLLQYRQAMSELERSALHELVDDDHATTEVID